MQGPSRVEYRGFSNLVGNQNKFLGISRIVMYGLYSGYGCYLFRLAVSVLLGPIGLHRRFSSGSGSVRCLILTQNDTPIF